MSKPLLELKAVLDEVLAILDAREQGPDRVLRRATLTLLSMEDLQDNLPGELNHKWSKLLACLRENAWIQHPEVGIAEIKRFHIAVLKAIQLPDVQTVR
jgi:hypothetical protein